MRGYSRLHAINIEALAWASWEGDQLGRFFSTDFDWNKEALTGCLSCKC